jgi:hypothetical protein
MNDSVLELYAVDGGFTLEELPQGDALAAAGCWFTASSASTASCPGTSAACVGSASTFSG